MMLNILRQANFQCTVGVYLMMQGTAGFERYMMQGNISGAAFDAVLQIIGFAMLWNSLDKMRGAS